jgi:hypothetical protein
MNRFDNAAWFKSSRSSGGGECVMVAFAEETGDLPTAVGVHDSKKPELGHFEVSPGAWAAFLSIVK